MADLKMTNQEARQFMLLKHGLIGDYKFEGKEGAMDFIKQAGCIQFDPVDICGKNAEISLLSRVKNFNKDMLAQLLYHDRLLIDYPDKQLSLIPTENWNYFERFREIARQNSKRFEGFEKLEKEALLYIEENGAVSSADLPLKGLIIWHSAIHWSGSGHEKTNASRAVLEQLYSTGELIIHHKKGTRKYYDLAKNHIPAEILNKSEPLPSEYEHIKWRVLRRIGAVGLLWNKPSSAWLGIHGLTNEIRAQIFTELENEKKITPVNVEGLKQTLYFLAEDEKYLTAQTSVGKKTRMELISPLDCFMWDRKLIQEIFSFIYTWEIYTPEEKRKYGAYTLPILYSENFAGRVDIACDRKTSTLLVKNIWLEEGIKNTKKFQSALSRTFKRFAKFNSCENISISRN